MAKSTEQFRQDDVRQSYLDSIQYVVPYDTVEQGTHAEVLEWVAGSEPLTKAESPTQHLGAVAFVTTVKTDKVFLINHRKAGAYLMPGGHVDVGNTLQRTIEEELAEELGLDVDMSQSMPFYVAKVLTQGKNAGHHDITAVFRVIVDPETEFTIQEKEADKAGWFDRSALADMPEFTLLPAIDRKLSVGKHVLLDNGGVLSDHYCAPYHKELADTLGIDETTLKQLLSEKSPQGNAYRKDLISREEFWGTVITLANADPSLDYSNLEKLWADSYQPKPEVISILRRYKNAGLKVGLVSNSDQYRKQGFHAMQGEGGFLDYSVVSCDVGVLKPEEEIFQKAVEVAETDAEKILYFDDRESHADAASNVGMRGMVFTDHIGFEEDISNFYKERI